MSTQGQVAWITGASSGIGAALARGWASRGGHVILSGRDEARLAGIPEDARDAAEGHEALVVSHQLPIWICRLHAEGRRFLHDPRRRQCTLCSVTSFEFDGDRLVTIGYSEPAADLIPAAQRNAAFSAGTGFQEPNDLAEQPGSNPDADPDR